MDRLTDRDYFMDRALVDDPYPYFEALREIGPVARLPAHNTIAVLGYEEGLAVYRDTEHFSAVNAVTGPLPPLPFAPEGDDIVTQIAEHRPTMPFGLDMLTLDPPHHTEVRSLCMRLFTPRRLKELESKIAALAEGLIDELAAAGGCEFVSAYAKPFSTLVIADLLGVPAEDRAAFRAMLSGPVSQVGADGAELVNPMDARQTMFTAYIEERKRAPKGDIMSELAQAAYPNGQMPEVWEVVRLATLLFGAGQDTTATLLSASLRRLAEDRALQAQLRADPSQIPAFIEEVLRQGGPVKSSYRLAQKHTTIAGIDVPAGTTVALVIAAMNRDPRRYDAPAEFRMGRERAQEHLGFGRGAHTCPGAALARAEVRISLELLLARFADISLDEAEHGPPHARRFSYAPTYVFRMLSHLHLRLKQAE
ncbi:MAG: cytochrome P450 [Novosphingobium sp.]